MRPYTGCASIEVCPAETSMMSAPARENITAISTASSGVTPCSPTQSLAEMRTDIGLSSGHTARIAENTSSGKRMRSSSAAAVLVGRWFDTGEMNDEIR